MKVIKPPEYFSHWEEDFTIFLAGSIEMGTAENWQDKLAKQLEGLNITILNPRRDHWDSSLVQSIDNPPFNEQVTWELNGIEVADLVVFYFDPNTKSPITLLELGLAAGLDKSAVVYCTDPFWRKGNVDIVCDRYGLPSVETFEALVSYITESMT